MPKPWTRWMQAARRRFDRWDAQRAQTSLAQFEERRKTQMREGTEVARPANLDTLKMVIRPDGLPVIEHPWATWRAPCVDEIPRILELMEALKGQADVVAISWDAFEGSDPDASLLAVEAFNRKLPRPLPSWMFTGTPDDLFQACALSVHTVPQTRVLHADGAVLKHFPGPLSSADVRSILSLLTIG